MGKTAAKCLPDVGGTLTHKLTAVPVASTKVKPPTFQHGEGNERRREERGEQIENGGNKMEGKSQEES